MKEIVAFASGIGVSVITAFVTYLFQKHTKRRQLRERASFQVYMLLLELNSQYFWIAGSEIQGEPAPPEITAKVRGLSFRISDKLRKADDVKHLEEILMVLMSEDAYKSANDRANALNAVIDKVGNSVNPRYAKLIRRISDDNVRGNAARPSGHRNNAPDLMF